MIIIKFIEQFLTDGFVKDKIHNQEAMWLFARKLDALMLVKTELQNQLKKIAIDKSHTHYSDIDFFMYCHVDEYKPEDMIAIFHTDKPRELKKEELIELLSLIRFGTFLNENGEQEYIVNFNFNPEYTDELLVMYFDQNNQMIRITQES